MVAEMLLGPKSSQNSS